MNRSYSKIRHIQEANLLIEKRLLESRSDNLKPLISEQDVKQGAAGDQFQYKKEGGKYFYAKKAEGTNAKWVEQTKEKGIDAIATKIFGDPAPSKTQTTTKPVDPNIPTKENTPLPTSAPTKTPTNTNTPSPTPAPTKTPTPTPTPAPTNTNTNTTIPTKPGSLVGKSYTFENKTCVIEAAHKNKYKDDSGKIEENSYFILPTKESGCRRGNGEFNGKSGYVYLVLNSQNDGGSLMSSFIFDEGNGWTYRPKSLGSINLK